MKNVLLIAFSLFVFSGCCTKVQCLYDENKDIYFTGFDTSELSEVNLVIRQTSDNSLVDSFVGKGVLIDGKIVLIRKPYMYKGYKYSLFVTKLNKEYILDNFTYKTERVHCNQCFFKREFDEKLSGYTVNGLNNSYDAANGFEIKK